MNTVPQDTIIGLLLAAGKSTRFIDASGKQSDKLAALLPNTHPAQSIIHRSAQTLLAACPRSIAVLKPDSPHQQTMQSLGLQTIIAQRAEQGMGKSLAAGARAAIAQGASGVIVMLADLPYVKAETVRAIADALRKGVSIAVPRYQGQQGHPVGFSHRHLPALAALSGDAGAKAVLRQKQAEIMWVDVEDDGIVIDVDNPEAITKS
jgi:molybdenum cofactor cytidylyltransferase